MKSVNLTKEEWDNKELNVLRRIKNSGLESIISGYYRKNNESNVRKSLADFYVCQDVLYDLLKPELGENSSLGISIYIATKVARESISIEENDDLLYFKNYNLDFNSESGKVMGKVLKTYIESFEVLNYKNLEEITHSFYNWTEKLSSNFLHKKMDFIKSKIDLSYRVLGKEYLLDIRSKNASKKSKKASQSDEETDVKEYFSEDFSHFRMRTVDWTEIGGNEEIIEDIEDELKLPFLHKGVYDEVRCEYPSGTIFYGPTGCGKSLIVNALATDIYKSKELFGGFHICYLKGSELANRFVGETEKAIRHIFDQARNKEGFKFILIEEAEAFLPERGSRKSSDTETTVVPSFLSEVNGININENIFVALTTNKFEVLDTAVSRDGRFDLKYYVGRPDRGTAKKIAKVHLKNRPLANEYENIENVDELTEHFAELFVKELYSDKYHLDKIFLSDGNEKEIYLRDVVHGAMIKRMINKTASITAKYHVKLGSKLELNQETINGVLDNYFEKNKSTLLNDYINNPPPELAGKIVSRKVTNDLDAEIVVQTQYQTV